MKIEYFTDFRCFFVKTANFPQKNTLQKERIYFNILNIETAKFKGWSRSGGFST